MDFFSSAPGNDSGEWIYNRSHYDIFSQIGTAEQGKFVFKHHLYCQDGFN